MLLAHILKIASLAEPLPLQYTHFFSHPSPPRILSFYNLTFPHLREQQQTTPLVKSAVQHAGEWGAGFHSYQNVQDFALSFLNMVV
jgi:hypothetical protein